VARLKNAADQRGRFQVREEKGVLALITPLSFGEKKKGQRLKFRGAVERSDSSEKKAFLVGCGLIWSGKRGGGEENKRELLSTPQQKKERAYRKNAKPEADCSGVAFFRGRGTARNFTPQSCKYVWQEKREDFPVARPLPLKWSCQRRKKKRGKKKD